LSNKISTLNEKSLHAGLKEWYQQKGDCLEVDIDGFIIDIVRGDNLIEIQTKNFSAIKRKLKELVNDREVRLVYPVAEKKWLVKIPENDGKPLSRRKSPKKGIAVDIFRELVSFPELVCCPRFTVELLFIHEEEIREYTKTAKWHRKGYVTRERRLLRVVDRQVLKDQYDFYRFIPDTLGDTFTTAELALAVSRSRRFAQQMAYCLRKMGCLTTTGKRGNAVIYKRVS